MDKRCHKRQELTVLEFGLTLEEVAGQPLGRWSRLLTILSIGGLIDTGRVGPLRR
jgi:hypothetical protein